MASDSIQLRPFSIQDTLSGEKRVVEPLVPGKISLYVCGVTVYDLTHIGHARVFVVFDVVQRFIRSLGYELKYVRNHTDVDDKIIARAAEVGQDPLELSAHFIAELTKDMNALGVAPADVEPTVSTHIPQIIAMVDSLIKQGYAYESDGDVYYRVREFEDYGKLSRRKLDDMEAGRSGRVDSEDESAQRKEYPFDFALWKKAKDGETSWESPWGAGRPGWHIECSAMSTHHLGSTIDIHGGGRDLVFPHHENEIAQAEACTHAEFSRNWMHVGMVNVAEVDESGAAIERKMSKSLGNFWTTRDALNGFHAEGIRYFFHATHYRKPITYSMDALNDATDRVEYFYTTLERIDAVLARVDASRASAPAEANFVEGTADTLNSYLDRFEESLSDDFNTPKAIAVLGEVAKVGNELTQSAKKPDADRAWTLFKVAEAMQKCGAVLGILQRTPADVLREIRDLRAAALNIDVAEVDRMIVEREEARAAKDWARADALRDKLAALNVEVMDSAQGSTWRFQ